MKSVVPGVVFVSIPKFILAQSVPVILFIANVLPDPVHHVSGVRGRYPVPVPILN